MIKLKIFLFLILLVFANSCSKENIKKDLINEKSLELQVLEAYQGGLDALEDGDVLYAAKKFNEAEILFPQGKLAPKSSLMAAYSYYTQDYYGDSIAELERFIKVYEDDLSDVYNSRTYCLYEDIELIKKNGLAKGGSLENAIVVKDEEILNTEGLRNEKEFVNHKILDCLGDLYTSGYRIVASIKCSQGGHYLTNQLLRKVFEKKENFSILEIKEKNLPHTLINRNLLKSIA